MLEAKLKKEYPDQPCDDPDSCFRPTYDVVGEFKFPYKSRPMMIAVGAVGNENGNPNAGAELSLFEFEQQETGWELISSEMDVIQVGMNGMMTGEIGMVVVGNDIYGLSFTSPWMQEGYFGEGTVIMARLKNHFQEILTLDTKLDDSGRFGTNGGEWGSKFRRVPGKNGFYDLIVKHTGTRKGESERFSFNGEKYVKIE